MDKWFHGVCADLEQKYGRGWKRRLAEMVGVSDSNVQNWLKTGAVPPAVKTAINAQIYLTELEEQNAELLADNVIVAEVSGEFQVMKFNEKTGRYELCIRATELEHAHAMIPIISGSLQATINDVLDRFTDLAPLPDDREALRRLENWKHPSKRETSATNASKLDRLISKEKRNDK